ncbi:endonuclease/exonuclease/phosphatase family protein [Vibrio sp. Isolate25]|uniref:endonuclease/exonuclease/phosphatase family protein n=1 Tax=Vibrio sp. Isolate25 TaxID=2908535 RepID=UPI001EFD2223|nr:endonuclease/exonuclease/phosphatase family protein [Vibrio sp. Isolate25]MCG9596084.1 endonuclease/exonuclease/phosphatase family protein [Vibrio sp. Isolate25]
MLTDKKLTFATANLFNFIEPPGAFYDFENIYEAEAWESKCRWTKNAIQQLNADIVGVQEVFSIDAAKRLFEGIGYQHFACVDRPKIESEYVYSQPVVAIASKYPILSLAPVEPPLSMLEGYSAPIPEFSRKPVCAVINVPDIGEVAIYVCHLKSQRATEADNVEKSHPLIGQWLSAQQRSWEAVMLRLFMEQQYARHPIPTVLMGDLNQPLTSDLCGWLTKNVEEERERLGLRDSWDIFKPEHLSALRPATHYHFAKGNVLDYILLSQEFQPDSQYSMAEVTAYTTLDAHLINPSFELDRQASDHAFIAVTVRFVL